MKHSCFILTLVAGINLYGSAQAVRLDSRAGPNLTLSSITVLASPATTTFVLAAGAQAKATPNITISTSINLSVMSTLKLYAYFAGPNALTNNSGDVIPTSLVFGQCTSGVPTVYTAFTQATPFGSSSGLLLYQQSKLLALGAPLSTALSLMIDLTGKRNIAAGTYTGTLVIQAQAM
jgi:hypothetical protein